MDKIAKIENFLDAMEKIGFEELQAACKLKRNTDEKKAKIAAATASVAIIHTIRQRCNLNTKNETNYLEIIKNGLG